MNIWITGLDYSKQVLTEIRICTLWLTAEKNRDQWADELNVNCMTSLTDFWVPREYIFTVPYNRINIATDVKLKKSVESMMNRDDIESVFFPKETFPKGLVLDHWLLWS